MTTLTNLPNGHTLVSNLSGGTKRRLSIAVALINNPSLAILDEPTVGIDALLRNQIWNYFVSKTAEGMTMIIVTHYIEEAVNAGRVGLMRNGALLAEDNPKRLMSLYKQPNLEAVFLTLCNYEDQGYKISTANNYENDGTQPNSYHSCYCSQYSIKTDNHNQDHNNNHNKHHHHHSNHNHHSSTNHHQPNNIYFISKFKESNCSISNCSSSWSTTWRTIFNFKLFTIKLWILMTLIYRNLRKFIHSYFSLVIILLPATQALIFCLAVSKDVTLVMNDPFV